MSDLHELHINDIKKLINNSQFLNSIQKDQWISYVTDLSEEELTIMGKTLVKELKIRKGIYINLTEKEEEIITKFLKDLKEDELTFINLLLNQQEGRSKQEEEEREEALLQQAENQN